MCKCIEVWLDGGVASILYLFRFSRAIQTNDVIQDKPLNQSYYQLMGRTNTLGEYLLPHTSPSHLPSHLPLTPPLTLPPHTSPSYLPHTPPLTSSPTHLPSFPLTPSPHTSSPSHFFSLTPPPHTSSSHLPLTCCLPHTGSTSSLIAHHGVSSTPAISGDKVNPANTSMLLQLPASSGLMVASITIALVVSSAAPQIDRLIRAHGILMVVAWPVLAVLGIFFAAWMKPALPGAEWFQVCVCVCVRVCVCVCVCVRVGVLHVLCGYAYLLKREE